MRLLLASICLMATTSGCISSRFSAMRVETQELTTDPLVALDVSTFNGNVTIRPADEPKVEMEITYKAYGATQDAAEANVQELGCDIQADNGTLILKAVKPSDQWMAQAAFEVKAPRNCDLKIVTSNGTVDVADFDAPVKIQTSNGTVKLANISGSIDAGTSNGTIHANNTVGPIQLSTSNGRINFAGFLVGTENRFSTSNGRVEVALPVDCYAKVNAKTSNGKVKCSLPNEELKSGKRSLEALVGLPQPGQTQASLSVRSSNGSITLKPMDDLPPATTEQPSGEVAQGSISDEADAEISGSEISL
ncbi:MAG: DUF4097 family beta strand repeat-containing protein [Planctomycetota bacterium]